MIAARGSFSDSIRLTEFHLLAPSSPRTCAARGLETAFGDLGQLLPRQLN